ncbi:hypothetical protein ACFLQN_04785 [Candidatus Aenigmatarchaeota archaeon]
MATEATQKKFRFVTTSDAYTSCAAALKFLRHGGYDIDSVYHVQGREPNPEIRREAERMRIASEETVDMTGYPRYFGGSFLNMKHLASNGTLGLTVDASNIWKMVIYTNV